MLRTPVSTTAVPPDLALADDASTLGEKDRGAVQLQFAAAQTTGALEAEGLEAEGLEAEGLEAERLEAERLEAGEIEVGEQAFPAETGGVAIDAAAPFAGALADHVDQEDDLLAPPAGDAAQADGAEDGDGARSATEAPFAITSEEAFFAADALEEAPAAAPPAGDAGDEVPVAAASTDSAREEASRQLSMPTPEVDYSPPRVAFIADAEAAGPPPSEAAQRHVTPLAGGPRTLTQAIDTAAKLAADANAAAEALDSLKRLLRQGLPTPTQQQPRAVSGVRRPQRLASAPPPVPAASPRRLPVAPLPPPPSSAEPMRIDVRGFLAGFALSWAIGVVLYLFMTAG